MVYVCICVCIVRCWWLHVVVLVCVRIIWEDSQEPSWVKRNGQNKKMGKKWDVVPSFLRCQKMDENDDHDWERGREREQENGLNRKQKIQKDSMKKDAKCAGQFTKRKEKESEKESNINVRRNEIKNKTGNGMWRQKSWKTSWRRKTKDRKTKNRSTLRVIIRKRKPTENPMRAKKNNQKEWIEKKANRANQNVVEQLKVNTIRQRTIKKIKCVRSKHEKQEHETSENDWIWTIERNSPGKRQTQTNVKQSTILLIN